MTAEPPILETSADVLLRESAWLRGLVAHLVGESHERDDIVQDVAVLGLTRAPRDVHSLRGWLATVVRRVAGRRRLRAERGRTSEARAARPEAQPSAHDVVARVEAHRRVVEAVLTLEEPYRSAVLLRFFEGRKPAAIATELGCPVATVRTRLSRGLQMLRGRLQARLGPQHGWALIFGIPVAKRTALTATTATTGAIVMGMHKKLLAVAGVGLALCVGAMLWSGGPEDAHSGVGDAPALVVEPHAAQAEASAPVSADAPGARTEVAGEPTVEVVPEPTERTPPRAGEVVAIVVDVQGRLLSGAQVWRAVERRSEKDAADTKEATSIDLGALLGHGLRGHARLSLAMVQGTNGSFELRLAPAEPAKPASVAESTVELPVELPIRDSFVVETPTTSAPPVLTNVPWGNFRMLAPHAEEHLRVWDLQPLGRTGRDGRCRFAAEGNVSLVATTPGTSSGIIAFDLPAQGAEVVLPVVSCFAARGVVVDAAGRPLEGAEVTAQPAGTLFPQPRLTTATTDREGRFNLNLDALGDYQLSARAGDSQSERLRLAATPGGDATVRVRMLGAVTLDGHLVGPDGAPIGSATVRAVRLGPDPQADPRAQPFEHAVAVDAQGAFQLLLPSAGEYVLAAAPDGHAPAKPVAVVIALGAAPPRVRLQCELGAVMHGHVRWTDGQAIADARVLATPLPDATAAALQGDARRAVLGEARAVSVAADGSYRIEGLAPHLRYRLSCAPDASREFAEEVRADVSASLQDFTFDREALCGASVRLLVQPRNGVAATEASVIVAHRDAKGTWRKSDGRGAKIDPTGQLVVEGLRRGETYAIELRCDGLGRCRTEPFVAGSANDLVLRPEAPGRLEVVVRDGAGRPCLGARVVLREPAAEGLRREDSLRTTDVLGRAQWDSVSVLPWTIAAERGHERAPTQDVVIESGGTVRVELQLER